MRKPQQGRLVMPDSYTFAVVGIVFVHSYLPQMLEVWLHVHDRGVHQFVT